ncbi:MAG: hypothetical protein FWE60_05085, partial [Oscillospiraceae bacterium]|nr:hypothetical protein [Oscillospiraceae bacterium]
MVNVSQEYIQNSLKPGRRVKCEIKAGDITYTDTDIISFEYNDVVHPDDMTFGTSCANRFRFELWSRHIIPLSAVIRPYVYFVDESNPGDEKNEERCCLGEFYITRRYRKRERYSITCYDKMYRLDAKYKTHITFPCSTSEILADIAWQYDFEVGLRLAYDVVETLPRNATCREIIGYIAGLNGGFAKFSRDGVLLLKKLRIFNNVSLTRDRYNELSLKADPLEIRQIDFIAGDDAFTAGAGTKLSTYRQINPFANQTATDRVFHEWKGFSYHGMTVKMRGLPYL